MTGDDQAIRDRVEAVLDEVRPFIQSDGGDIALVSVEAGIVRVRMQGACVGCASSKRTIHFGIERRLREEIPEIKVLEAV